MAGARRYSRRSIQRNSGRRQVDGYAAKAEEERTARVRAWRETTGAPIKKYGVVVEDFEWHFEVYSRETGMVHHAANHYSVSEYAHTAAETVERTKDRFECAASDCVLFMWATVPTLAVAIDVLRLRGFTYVSNYAWGKNRIAIAPARFLPAAHAPRRTSE